MHDPVLWSVLSGPSAASSLASGVRLTSTMGKTKENGSLVFDLLIPETDYEVIGFALDVEAWYLKKRTITRALPKSKSIP